MIYDSLSDIIKHTHGLGFIESVKLYYSSETGTTHVESIVDNSVVLYGKMAEPIDGLDSTIGLTRMSVLSGYLNFLPFTSEKAHITIMTQERNGVSLPTAVQFNSNVGHSANYRFMSKQQVESEIQIPTFMEPNWDVVFSPSRQAVRDLSALRSIVGSLETDFIIETKDNKLNFLIGSDSTDSSKVTFATDVMGVLRHSYQWSIRSILPILRLGEDAASITVSISDAGIAKFEIDSGIGVYTYLVMKKAV